MYSVASVSNSHLTSHPMGNELERKPSVHSQCLRGITHTEGFFVFDAEMVLHTSISRKVNPHTHHKIKKKKI